MVFFLPLGLVIGFGGAKLSPRKDVVATTKLVTGVVGIGLLHLAAVFAVGWFFGWLWGLAAFAILLVSGWATLRVLKRFDRLARLSKRAWRAAFFGTRLDALRQERAALVEAVSEAVEKFIPKDMKRLFG
jgi:hypothetical protein